jgi:alpha-beta hydrolase superfamily lysophospholipase
MDSTTMLANQFHFNSSDGVRIICGRWESRGTIRGVVQIAHGLGEHIGRYSCVIERMTEAGLVVYGNDHRGHGRTAQATNSFGDFGPGGFNLLVEDIARLTAIAKHEYPDMPFILLGHSMGSFAAQQFVTDHSEFIDGLALSGSGALDGLVRLVNCTGRPPIEIANAAFEPARTACDWLTRDPAVVDAFISDPLCFGSLQPRASASFFAAASVLADPGRLRQIRKDLPIYVFSGSEDPVGQQLEGARVLLERYRAADIHNVDHDFYPGGRHEMLNEINRDEVLMNLLRWIKQVLSSGEHVASRSVGKRRRAH